MNKRDVEPGPMSDNARLGSAIARLRGDNGLTQLDLATKLRVSKATISQIEAGNTRAGFDTIVAIATALGVSVERLVWESNDKRRSNPVLREVAPIIEDAITELDIATQKGRRRR